MDELLNISYRDAMDQLDKIIQDLENGAIEIDELDSTMERAQALLAYCQEKLRKIESKIERSKND